MAVVKVHNIYKTLEKSVQYVMNPDKTASPNGIAYDIYSNCGLPWDAGDVIEGMLATQNAYEATRTVGPPSTIQAWHIIQSFAPGEVDRETAQQIGQELCERMFHDQYDFVLATHHDRGHIHNHIIVKPIHRETLTRLYYVPDIARWHERSTLTQLRSCSDDLCKKYGLSVITPARGSDMPSRTQIGELYARAEARSKKTTLRRAIDTALIQSFSWGQFRDKLMEIGISVVPKGNDILFYAPQILDKRIRGRTLGPAFTEQALMDRLSRDILHEFIVANRMIRPYDERRVRIQLPGSRPPQFVILDNQMAIQHPNNWRIYVPDHFTPVTVDQSGNVYASLTFSKFSAHFTEPTPQVASPAPTQSGLSQAYAGTRRESYERVMDQKFQAMSDRLEKLSLLDAFLDAPDKTAFLDSLARLSGRYHAEIREGVLANQRAQDQNLPLPVDPSRIHDLQRRIRIIHDAQKQIQAHEPREITTNPAPTHGGRHKKGR